MREGALISVNVVLGIPILRALSPEESAQLMLYTINQVTNVTNSAIPRREHRPRNKRKLQLNILQGLPGIRPKRAEQLLKKFGSNLLAWSSI